MNIQQVKENVRKMAAQNAPMEDIDGYINAAGYTVDDIRNYKILPQITPKTKEYSALEKAKYTARAGLEGATFGLGDVAAGMTNIPSTLIARLFTGPESLPIKDKNTGEKINIDRGTLNPIKLFKSGRKSFVEEQNDFAKEHRYLNTGGELIGGIASAVIGGAGASGAKAIKSGAGTAVKNTGLVKNLLRIASKGGKQGGKFGGLYGAGSGLTDDAENLSPLNALWGSAQGAIIGAPMGAVVNLAAAGIGAGLNKAGQGVKNYLFNRGGRAFDKLNEASGGALEKSVEAGVPFVDRANKKSLRIISGVNLIDDKASEVLNRYGNRRMQQHKVNSEKLIDKTFGKKGYENTLQEVQDSSKKLYDDLYSKAMSKGVLKINWDDDLRRFLGEVRNNKDIASAIKKYPDSHMRVLDQVKQAIDSRIKRVTEHEGGLGLANLQAIKERLLQQMDKQNQYYRIGRQIFERTKTFERGAEQGTKIFENPYTDIVQKNQYMGRGGAKPDFAAMRKEAAKLKGYGVAERRIADINTEETIYNSMAEAEKAGFKAGAAKKMRLLAESSTAEYENVAQKLFGLNRLRKLRAAGVDISKIEEAAEDEIMAAQNMRNLFRGSQTAERSEDIGNAVMGPLSFAKKYTAAKINQLTGIKPMDIARIATEPDYARAMQIKAHASSGKIPFVEMQSSGPVAGLVGPGAEAVKQYRNDISNKLMNSVRNTEVYSPNADKTIRFNRAGISKAITSGADLKKLKMLEGIKEIVASGYPISKRYSDPKISTLMTPIKVDGIKEIAAITTRKDNPKAGTFFYNVNPLDYWINGSPSANPAYKSGAKGLLKPKQSSAPRVRSAERLPNRSIQNRNKIFKPEFNMLDFLRILKSPQYSGIAVDILKQTKKENK